jgi:hypothetical protein
VLSAKLVSFQKALVTTNVPFVRQASTLQLQVSLHAAIVPLEDIKTSLINPTATLVQLVNSLLAVVARYARVAQLVRSLLTQVQQLAHLVLLVDMLTRQASRLAEYAVLVSSRKESATPCARRVPPVSDQLCLEPEVVRLALPAASLLVRTT